jgi:tetratricopeptide (TPR) repeat protein
MGSPSSRVDHVALAHGSALTILAEAPPLQLPKGVTPDAAVISERTLRRRLGLLSVAPDPCELTEADVQRATGLAPETLRCLILFDVLEPVDELYSFRDLRSAREAKRLLNGGFGLDEIVEASVALRRSGRGLWDTPLADAPWGEVMQLIGGRLGHLDGQFALDLEDATPDLDEIFAMAEDYEEAGELQQAERFYRLALRLDDADPVIPFNLGNVLAASERHSEAVLYYRLAIARDASFFDARVNLAAIHEARGHPLEAEAELRSALTINPTHDIALHNLALILTRAGHFDAALPLWDKYLAIRPPPEQAGTARRLRTLCGMEVARRAPR